MSSRGWRSRLAIAWTLALVVLIASACAHPRRIYSAGGLTDLPSSADFDQVLALHLEGGWRMSMPAGTEIVIDGEAVKWNQNGQPRSLPVARIRSIEVDAEGRTSGSRRTRKIEILTLDDLFRLSSWPAVETIRLADGTILTPDPTQPPPRRALQGLAVDVAISEGETQRVSVANVVEVVTSPSDGIGWLASPWTWLIVGAGTGLALILSGDDSAPASER